MPRLPDPRMTRFHALLPVLLLLAGCREVGHQATYRFPEGRAQSLRYEASLTGRLAPGPDGPAAGQEGDGFRDSGLGFQGPRGGIRGQRPYDARASANLILTAAPDSASGRIGLDLAADSVSFQASDRDDDEGRYMQERLLRYKAKMVLSPSGQVLAMEEEPDLPPVDFSPLNFGRFLAFAMPAFPMEPVKHGSEWTSEQALLDKFHPGSKVVKRYKVRSIKETAEGRLMECSVSLEAWLEDGLVIPASDASGESARPALSGRGEAVFNLDRGLPVSSALEMEGRFNSQVREGGVDSGRVVDLPVQLALRLDLRFGR